ncbi:hypothetical protein ACWEPC_02000 [Nonomuraea sp. NPDC004297]
MRYKKWLIRAAIAFAAFYLIAKPANAADAVNSAVGGVLHGADQLAVFFSSILV